MTPIPDCMAVAAERARFIGYPLAAELIERRRAYGIATHGTPLAWPNGRNWLADWAQEALDAAAGYTTGLVAEMRQQGAPKHLIRGVLAHSTGALELIEEIELWRRSAGLPDLLTQQPPPEGGHEAPDVARRELAAAREEIANLRGSLDLLRVQRAATERAHDAALAEAREAEALRARVAELEEAARWRPGPEAPLDVEVLIATSRGYVTGKRIDSRHRDPWITRHGSLEHHEVRGWRPLGPGPEVAGG